MGSYNGILMVNNGSVLLFFLSELLKILFDKRSFFAILVSIFLSFHTCLCYPLSFSVDYHGIGHQTSCLPDSPSRLGTQQAFPRYADGHVDGSVNIPHTQMLGRVDFSRATTGSGERCTVGTVCNYRMIGIDTSIYDIYIIVHTHKRIITYTSVHLCIYKRK